MAALYLQDKKKIGFIGVSGKQYPVYTGQNKIGRDYKVCDIVLNSEWIAKQHVILYVSNKEKIILMDLGSPYKTKLSNVTLAPYMSYRIKDRDTFHIGKTSAVLMLDDIPSSQMFPVNREKIGFIGACAKRYPVYIGRNMIGSSEPCNVILNHETISPLHAVIHIESATNIVIMDLFSSNKTILRNQELKPYTEYVINDGELFQLGDIYAILELDNLHNELIATPVISENCFEDYEYYDLTSFSPHSIDGGNIEIVNRPLSNEDLDEIPDSSERVGIELVHDNISKMPNLSQTRQLVSSSRQSRQLMGNICSKNPISRNVSERKNNVYIPSSSVISMFESERSQQLVGDICSENPITRNVTEKNCLPENNVCQIRTRSVDMFESQESQQVMGNIVSEIPITANVTEGNKLPDKNVRKRSHRFVTCLEVSIESEIIIESCESIQPPAHNSKTVQGFDVPNIMALVGMKDEELQLEFQKEFTLSDLNKK